MVQVLDGVDCRRYPCPGDGAVRRRAVPGPRPRGLMRKPGALPRAAALAQAESSGGAFTPSNQRYRDAAPDPTEATGPTPAPLALRPPSADKCSALRAVCRQRQRWSVRRPPAGFGVGSAALRWREGNPRAYLRTEARIGVSLSLRPIGSCGAPMPRSALTSHAQGLSKRRLPQLASHRSPPQTARSARAFPTATVARPASANSAGCLPTPLKQFRPVLRAGTRQGK